MIIRDPTGFSGIVRSMQLLATMGAALCLGFLCQFGIKLLQARKKGWIGKEDVRHFG